MAQTVAIVGDGPSGLAALKAAQEEGLDAFAFDLHDEPGGLWTAAAGLVWPSLRTNLSKFSCSFSDFPHCDATTLFPSAAEISAYLQAYAARFGLVERLRLKTAVVCAEPIDQGWRVTVRDQDGFDVARKFDQLIIASGFFSRPLLPAGVKLGRKVTHAGAYRGPEPYRDQRVLVIGSAFSGCDVAAEVATVARTAAISVRRPFWTLPRMIPSGDGALVPLDLEFYSRESAYKKGATDPIEREHRRHAYFSGLVDGQRDLPEMLKVPDDGRGAPIVISDTFPAAVRRGVLKVVETAQLDIVSVCGAPEEHGFDSVILATGYGPGLGYLPEVVLRDLGHVSDDALQPLLLAHTVFPASTKRLAFVGMYRGPFFAVIELQARWACGVLSGRLSPLSDRERADAIDEEATIRARSPRPQFPHADYVAMADDLAQRAGVMPDLAAPSALARELNAGPLLPAHFRLSGPFAAPEIAAAEIDRVAAYLAQGK